MRRPLFLPTPRQANWLLAIAFLAGGGSALSALHGDRERQRRSCLSGRPENLAVQHVSAGDRPLQSSGVFGAVALAAALLNLIRPSLVLIGLALAAAGFGIVLHNADLSALAAGVLILSLARPAPAPE